MSLTLALVYLAVGFVLLVWSADQTSSTKPTAR